MKSVLVVFLLCTAVPASAQSLNLSKLYADGAVVQRDVPLPVFGHALPGAAVEVTLAGMRAEATADASGQWVAQLPALPAGGPHTMTVVSGEESLTVTDVHAGDVWLASGQSNMEWTVASSANAAAEVSAANDPMIRHFK
ncbi:MAG: 9-O-acetylesterase, partial [Bacteroidota bacterium]